MQKNSQCRLKLSIGIANWISFWKTALLQEDKCWWRFAPASLEMAEQSDQNNDGDRNAEDQQKNGTHIFLL